MIRAFNFINLFRAVAAYWVLVAHCIIWGGWSPPFPVPDAKIAVDLFMMISGYLMAANAAARANLEPLEQKQNWIRFWLRRFFRLAPGYYLSLLVAVLTSTYFLAGYHHLQQLTPLRWPPGGVYDPLTTVYDFKNIWLHLTFLFGLSPRYSFSTFLPDWSLSLEMQFYIAFPILYLCLHRGGFVKIGTVLGLVCFAAGVAIQRIFNFDEPSLLIFKLNYFIAGILIYRFLASSYKRESKPLLALAAISLVSIDARYHSQLLLLPILASLMLVLGWLETQKTTPEKIRNVVNSKIITFASNTSYGVYLFHGFYISGSGLLIHSSTYLQSLAPADRVAAMIAFVSCCTYITAYFVYKFVEIPFIEAGKKVINRLAPVKTNKNAHESAT
ncbi:acyltransferase family protein [Ideonella dechloratans]|uniref:acyltransferase family protein n=1 Tax=Ideonella dechloratans TaxID=36863 RepID=UPI0035B44909